MRRAHGHATPRRPPVDGSRSRAAPLARAPPAAHVSDLVIGGTEVRTRGSRQLAASPAKPVGLRITYYKLRAFHPFAGPPAMFGAGTDRGHLLQARLDFTLHRSLRGHVLYEGLWPGDFTRHESSGHFFPTELIYTFRKAFASR